ncbi:MAG: DNA polymerase [Ignavibacteriae bacterium]|nr:DNA polymerase [Ignavibacteriota bacterium]
MDPLLYGHNPEQGIVAVRQASDSTMRVYIRSPEGLTSKEVEFYPFFLLSDSSFLDNFPIKHWVKELQGSNFFRYLCAFTRWSEMWDAVHHIIEVYNRGAVKRVESFNDLPILHLRYDPVSQFLMQTGRTLFKGMNFEDLHRLQLDIETYTKHGQKFSNPNRPEDQIILIALSDNRGWEYVISGKNTSEKEMLLELVQIIRERDVDVIEGHNIFNFDLPYILKRCELCGIDFTVGRDGSSLRSSDSRSGSRERFTNYILYEIDGRHIIDTMLLLQSYDQSKRVLEHYGLKYAAQYFGFAKEDRMYIPADRISWYWDHEPDLLVRYALDDVRETRLLSDHLSRGVFYLAQMIPFNYGTAARLGSAVKIESLFVREYLHQKHSIPKPQMGAQTSGGYTDIFYTGLLGPIVDIDVESLYPSIMIGEKIGPKSDTLGICYRILENLTRMRLDAKRRMNKSENQTERMLLDALQSSFKILINSFYGYLGYSRGLFNDYEAADKVTQSGQKILHQLINSITSHLGIVVEVDTDGIFFVPPRSFQGEEKEKEFVKMISKDLPRGINLVMNGRYKVILSYKKKNYALLGYDNKIVIKGSSLISRSMEKFGRYFIQQCVDALLNRNINGLHELYLNVYRDIIEHKLSVADFAKTETLRESREEYLEAVEKGHRNRTAAYEVALANLTHWKIGDRIAYYITGTDMNVKGFEHCKLVDEWDPNFPDENMQYYLKRLLELAKKFEVFFTPEDFHAIFSTDDLFGFSAEGITPLMLHVPRVTEEVEEEESEVFQIHPTIELDESEHIV